MSATTEKQISIVTLAREYNRLAQLLMAQGLHGPQLNAILSQNLRVECVLCHHVVSADELSSLTLAVDDSTNPKLKRLLLGYCARVGCNSMFYSFKGSGEEINWPAIWQQMDGIPLEPAAPGQVETASAAATQPARSYFWRNVAAILLGVMVITVFWFWWTGRPIPILQPKHQFTVDPKSIKGQ